MHCNLRPSALITTLCQGWSSWTYPLPYYSVFVDDTLLYAVSLTSDPVILTSDLWSWTFATYRLWRDETVYQIWTQLSNPRRSYAISMFALMTLNIAFPVALGSGIIFTKFEVRQLIRAWIIPFYADTLCHAVTLTFDLLIFKVRGTSSVTLSKSVQNLSELEKSSAELLIIWRIFAHVMSRCDLDLLPLYPELL